MKNRMFNNIFSIIALLILSNYDFLLLNKKRINLILILGIGYNVLNAQDIPRINYVDTLGRKQGLWITEEFGHKYEYYYKDGLKDGTYLVYAQKGVGSGLWCFGKYMKDKIIMMYEFHDEKRFLLSSEDSIVYNEDYTKDTINNFKYRSYVKFYWDNGLVRECGFMQYNWGVDYESVKIGEWLYYDEEGKLIKKMDETRK